VWLGLGLAAGLLFALAVWALLAAFYLVFDGDTDHVADVQRFVALTEEARSLVPAGLPLFDGEKAAATTAARVRFQAKKDEARRALWASRNPRSEIRARSPRDAASSESRLAVAKPSNQEASPSRFKGHDQRNGAAAATEQEELVAQGDRIDARLPARRGDRGSKAGRHDKS
jgi:hypothetical protein